MGYVGCVTAACMSKDGHQVIGVDIDPGKVDLINQGVPPVFEPGLSELLSEQVEAGRLRATTQGAEAVPQSDLALVAVGTPSGPDGGVQTTAVESVVADIARSLVDRDGPYTLVLRSTLLPNIIEDSLLPIMRQHLGDRVGDDVHVCTNPEFLRETTAIADYYDPPFVLVGADHDDAAEMVLQLYTKVEAKQLRTDRRTSAMVKYACNAFHALKVAFGNEIGTLAKALDADGKKVMEIVCEDHRLNISPAYLRPGFAFGGSCLPKDVRALSRFAQRHAIGTQLLSSVVPSNDDHLQRGLQLIKERGIRRIGLVGLSFKAGTDDLRESPFVILAETLLGQGYDLRIYDPGVQVSRLTGANLAYVDEHLHHLANLLVDDPQALYEHAEAYVVGTSVVNDLDAAILDGKTVIDLRSDLVTPLQVPSTI